MHKERQREPADDYKEPDDSGSVSPSADSDAESSPGEEDGRAVESQEEPDQDNPPADEDGGEAEGHRANA